MDFCSHCEVAGFLADNLEDQPGETNLRMLFSTHKDETLCFLCLMRSESRCFHCLQEASLIPETRCQAKPLVCQNCVDQNSTIHIGECYASGCMTPEEFALEAQQEIEEEQWSPENFS